MKQTRLAAIADELIKLANLVKLADLEEMAKSKQKFRAFYPKSKRLFGSFCRRRG